MYWNRTFQREVLLALRERYPLRLYMKDLPRPAEGPPLEPNLWYLDEHGLINIVPEKEIGRSGAVVNAKITAKGLDFLEDDGGLGAILGVVTVKLDSDMLRGLMVARVESSDLSPTEKKSAIHAIRSFSASVLRDVATRLVSEGLTRSPDALQLLQTGAGF